MIGMSGHAVWLEDDERGDVGREPVVDASVEFRVRDGIETAVREVEQRDVRNAQDAGRLEEFSTADAAEVLGRTDGAGFAMGEAQHADLTPLTRQIGEQCAKPKSLVI